MTHPGFCLLFLLSAITSSCAQLYHDTYHEEAFLKPLASGHINTYFQFTTQLKYSAKSDRM